MFVVFLVHSST